MHPEQHVRNADCVRRVYGRGHIESDATFVSIVNAGQYNSIVLNLRFHVVESSKFTLTEVGLAIWLSE